MRPSDPRAPLVGALALVALGSVACGSSGSADGVGNHADNTRTVSVTLTNAGCPAPESSYPAGPLTFQVKNKNATAVSELELLSGDRIIGEKENLPPGFSGSFALQLDAGTYTLYCPGAANEHADLRVTGTSSTKPSDTNTAALLKQATKDYGQYVVAQTGTLVTMIKPLVKALHGTDLAAAQTAYEKARPYYERIEPVAESFTVNGQNLDAEIDARAGDVPASKWQGFHYIERGLFQKKSLAGLAPYGDKLLANAQKLQQLVDGLTYQPAELANGAVSLLDEVSRTKITGEEERYSHIDLLDFQANVEGSQQAFGCLQPALERIDPALAKTISQAFATLTKRLDGYRTSSNASGFDFYGTLTDADKTQLSQDLQAVAEPLSRVAGKVVNG